MPEKKIHKKERKKEKIYLFFLKKNARTSSGVLLE
jgi:hypothetical protein